MSKGARIREKKRRAAGKEREKMKRRVVVTGLGAVTPIGNNVDEFWKSVKEGKCGIGPITRFDTSEYKVHLAAEVKDFNAKDYLDFKTAKRMGRFPTMPLRHPVRLSRTQGWIWRTRILTA